jgi:hypothetical protein
MWFDPGLAELFITSTLVHLEEDINLLVVMLSPFLNFVFNLKPLIVALKFLKLHFFPVMLNHWANFNHNYIFFCIFL